MADAHDHMNHVNTWMGQAAKGLSREQLLQLFEQAMSALWNRAHLTLGDVTLTAIMDRVLHNACERFPPFESLKIEGSSGIDCRQLRQEGKIFNDSELQEGIRFVVVEFLVVIGTLTGELITPVLHSELSKIRPKASAPGGKQEEGKS